MAEDGNAGDDGIGGGTTKGIRGHFLAHVRAFGMGYLALYDTSGFNAYGKRTFSFISIPLLDIDIKFCII